MKTMQEKIEEKLKSVFYPMCLEVVNESDKHSGHIGDDGSGESHFRVEIVSDAFKNTTVVASHRMIYDCLQEELETIHALSISASSHKK
ncbi:MAG: BolA family transcriptional regulator [Alphaproteobacteria bacterium]|nr:MAG: BolA family transcriptional regulator [Alphaproteobacteria bacterium]